MSTFFKEFTGPDWCATIIGSGGLFVAMFSIILGWWKDRIHVGVKASVALAEQGGQVRNMLGIEVVNKSRRPVTVRSINFCDAQKKKYFSFLSRIQNPTLQFPKRLEPLDVHTFAYEMDSGTLHQVPEELNRAIVNIAGSKPFYSKKGQVKNIIDTYKLPPQSNDGKK
ncbi:hypothetical protein ACFL54_09710 [Planctomycetota bacterium]